MKKFSSPFWLIFFLFLISRIYPYFNNPIPLGYDGGIYLYIFKTFPSIPEWFQLGFSPGLFAFIYPFLKLNASPESLLIPLSIFSQIVLFFSIYFVAKKTFGEKNALITAFVLAVSPIQFRTFWFFYIKNTFALSFLVLSLYFISKKSLVWASLFGILVGLFHLPTFVIFFLILVFEALFNSKNRFFYIKVLTLVLTINGFYYLPYFKESILAFLTPMIKSSVPAKVVGQGQTTGGTFYSILTSTLLTIFYLPISIYGLFSLKKIKDVNFRPFAVGFIVCFLIVYTKFFFYQRFFIAFDIFLIIFAGIGFNNLLQKYKENSQVREVLNFYPVVLVIFIFAFVFKTSQPLINKTTFSEIKYFGQQKKSGYILSTSKEDSAWLLGYTNLPVIANSYGGYSYYWNTSQWKSFVGGPGLEKEIRLLKLLPQPLYIFINDKSVGAFAELIGSKCLKSETMHFYRFDCR